MLTAIMMMDQCFKLNEVVEVHCTIVRQQHTPVLSTQSYQILCFYRQHRKIFVTFSWRGHELTTTMRVTNPTLSLTLFTRFTLKLLS